MTPPGMVSAGGVLTRLGRLPRSLASGPHRLLRLAFAFCALLVTRLTTQHLVIIGVVGLIGVANWLAVRATPPRS